MTQNQMQTGPYWFQDDNNYKNVHIFRIRGKYKGDGFIWIYKTLTENTPINTLLCEERTNGALILFDSNLPAGSYCEKLFGGKLTSESTWGRIYSLKNKSYFTFPSAFKYEIMPLPMPSPIFFWADLLFSRARSLGLLIKPISTKIAVACTPRNT